jgi:hypothetical protein
MAGVMTALEADDDVGLLRQPVDDLAFAFVSPLGADHHHIRHKNPSPKPGATCSAVAPIRDGAPSG